MMRTGLTDGFSPNVQALLSKTWQNVFTIVSYLLPRESFRALRREHQSAPLHRRIWVTRKPLPPPPLLGQAESLSFNIERGIQVAVERQPTLLAHKHPLTQKQCGFHMPTP